MDKNNIFGFNSSFYYFGLQHLVLNMYNYIKDGIDKNEKIYVCMAPEVYNELASYLSDIYGFSYVENFRIHKIISCYNKLKLNEIRAKLSKHIDEIVESGYSGVRFIIQADYMILSSSREYFMDFNKSVLYIILGLKASFMSLYDFEDYLKHKYIIDDEVILESYRVHSHRLYNGNLQNCRGLSHSK